MANKTKTEADAKNPWIAAILNVLIWGLGYLYVGKPKRAAFSAGLVITAVLSYVSFYGLDPVTQAKIGTAMFLESTIMSIILAWDAYRDAKEN